MRLRHVQNAEKIIETGIYNIKNPTDYRGRWSKLFKNNHPIYIEIGMGKGDFIIENANRYPDINFIGIEKFDSVIVRAIQKSNELNLSNLKLIRMDAIEIDSVFFHEVDLIYLNFSDPWPKKKQAKRRLTSSNFLDKYETIFKKNKHLIMKTDNPSLFEYSIESLMEYGYRITYKTTDLYKEDVSLNIPTEYEKKFVKDGKPIYKLEAIKVEKEAILKDKV